VAANVFASMLGVASAVPYIPGQQTRDAAGRSQGQGPTQPPYPQQNMAQPQGNNAMGMQSPAGLSSNDLLQVFGAPGIPQNSMGNFPQQNYASPQEGYRQAPGNSMGNMSPGIPQQQAMPMNNAGFSSHLPGDNSSGQTKQQAKSDKRGFFSKFMDWLSR